MRTKKLFFSVLALAGMLFANSCTQEDIVGEASGDFVSATFTLSTADGLATRAAIGDGTTVDEVACAVYDANGNELEDLRQYVKVEGRTATYSIRLAKGLNYRVAFFAYNKAAAAYDVTDLKNIVVKPGQLSNLESRDAFTGYYDVKKGETMNTITTTVDLCRPFAQLNLGIDATELKAAADAGAVVKKSYIKVSNVYNAFSAYDNAVVATDAAEEMEFAMNTIPAEALTVGEATYTYLAMNYLLVGDENAEKSLTDVTFVWEDENGVKNDPAISFFNIPVQRNYRTNITGRLLTSPADFTITIDAAFKGEHPGESEKTALEMAASVGGKYTLTEDIVLDNTLNITNDLILDLNGKTISGTFSDKENESVIKNTGKLTLIGGEIKNIASNGAAVITNSGQLVLKGVTINGAPIGTEGYPSYAVYSSGELTIEEGTTISSDRGCLKLGEDGKTVINGGTFTNKDISPRTLTSHVVDVESDGKNQLTINGGTFQHLFTKTSGGVVICNRTKETVYVNGGNFSGGNYYGNNNLSDYGYGGTFTVTGGTYSAQPAAKYIATGYVASANDNGTYTVVPGVKLDNNADFETAINNAAPGSTIVLPDNITKEVTVGELKDVTIEGSKNTSMRFVTNADSKIENVTIKNIDFGFTTGSGQKGACVVIDKDAEINNLVLDNITFVGDGNKNSYGITGQNSTASIIVKNCNFSNLGYAIQTISGGGYESLIVEKCTFDNIISWAILPQYGYNGDLTINDCTFKNSNGGLVKTGAFTGTFTFTNNTITNCTGHDGEDSKWFDVKASADTNVINGNTKDGAAWTPGEANGLK